MSSRARRQEAPYSSLREEFSQVGKRLRQAQAEYERFLATSPLGNADTKPHKFEEMRAAQEKLQAAEAEIRELSEKMRSVYARLLRKDASFKERSDEAERQLAEGPPWDDAFSPSELLKESTHPDR